MQPIATDKATPTTKSDKNGSKSRAREPGGRKNNEIAKKLFDLLNSDDLAGAVAVWRSGMKATKFVWSQKAQCYIDTGFPDWDVRERMSLAIAAYMEGKPIERQVQVTGSFEDLGQMIGRINASPAAMRELGDEIDVRAMAQPKSEKP